MTDIEPCIIHSERYDDDCELCATEQQLLSDRLAEVNQGTVTQQARLAQMGQAIDLATVALMRINAMLDVLVNPKQRHRFEIAFIESFAVALAETEERVSRQRLLQDIHLNLPKGPL